MLKIQFLDRRQPAFWLVDPRLTIGRDKSNGLVINDEGVSVFHAELQQEDGKLYLRDAGSVNGTFLNDQPVTQRTEVHVNDVIRLHLVELQIIDPTKAPPENAPAIKREIPKAGPLWQVKATTGVISGRMFPIEGTKVVGRDPHCDIVVGGAHVSRRHAEFSVRGGQLWVKDLGSSNGSFVNGKKHDEIQLKNGDEVKFDAMTFKVVGPTEPVAVDNFEEEAERTQFRPVAGAAKTASPAPAPKPHVAESSPSAHTPPPVSAPEPVRPAAPLPQHQPATPSSSGEEPKGNVGTIVVVILIVIGVLSALFLL